MKKEEAISYLQQIYPNGGYCWLDNQRIEAIGMAIDALQEEPVSENLEEASRNYADYEDYGDDCYFAIKAAFKAGAQWQKEKMLKDAVEREVKVDAGGYPYIDATIELYDYIEEKPLAKVGDKVKVIAIVIKDN